MSKGGDRIKSLEPILFLCRRCSQVEPPTTLTNTNFDVKFYFVDNESLTNMLFYDDFQRMKLSYDQLQKINAPLVGFIGS